MKLDFSSGNEIRKTDNGLREEDLESPQVNRLLEEDEIAELIVKAGATDGDA